MHPTGATQCRDQLGFMDHAPGRGGNKDEPVHGDERRHREGGRRPRTADEVRLSHLEGCQVVTTRAPNGDGMSEPRCPGDHLVRDSAPHRTRVGTREFSVQPAAADDRAEQRGLPLILRVHRRDRRREAVGVCHHELPALEQGARSGLVAKPQLDLEDRSRQVVVPTDARRDQLGGELLVRRGQHQVLAASTTKPEQCGAELVGSRCGATERFAPQRRRLEHREQHLLRAHGRELLSHDRPDPADDTVADREQRDDPRRSAMKEPATDERIRFIGVDQPWHEQRRGDHCCHGDLWRSRSSVDAMPISLLQWTGDSGRSRPGH